MARPRHCHVEVYQRPVTAPSPAPSMRRHPAPRARCYSRQTTVALAMTQLSLRLLGGFRAQHGPGRPLTIRRKAQALLAYLALHPGAASSRDALAGLLWSGTTDEHARHNLRQTLFALRQAITPDPFIVEGELVGLRESAVQVDVAAFERGVGRGTREALREATTLYRGELLEGLRVDEAPFDDWLATERQRLRNWP
jgi:DNA-binding SARP family transcriptional activator